MSFFFTKAVVSFYIWHGALGLLDLTLAHIHQHHKVKVALLTAKAELVVPAYYVAGEDVLSWSVTTGVVPSYLPSLHACACTLTIG